VTDSNCEWELRIGTIVSGKMEREMGRWHVLNLEQSGSEASSFSGREGNP
jgi:hypothetical protein